MNVVATELFEDLDRRRPLRAALGMCVSVIGRESFMREAVRDSLIEAGVELVHNAPTLKVLGERLHRCNAILYMEPSDGDLCADEDIEMMGCLPERNWILMARDKHSRFLSKLLKMDANVSVIPFDVSRTDLAHFAHLAANGRSVVVDQFCEVSSSTDVGIIKSAGLTDEQNRLLRLLAEGLSNKEIAIQEDCAENTVKMRVRALLTKLNVSNRTRAAVIAARAGFRFNWCSERRVETEDQSHSSKVRAAVG